LIQGSPESPLQTFLVAETTRSSLPADDSTRGCEHPKPPIAPDQGYPGIVETSVFENFEHRKEQEYSPEAICFRCATPVFSDGNPSLQLSDIRCLRPY
jgi:hypothetical protein